MKGTTIQLIEDLEIQLAQTDNHFADPFQKAQQSLTLIHQCLHQLKLLIESTLIRTLADEIWFFKTAKPLVVSKKLYFSKILEMTSCHKGGIEAYLHEQQSEIKAFYSDNNDFCRYIKSNLTCLDDRYFVRGNNEMHLCIDPKWRDPSPEPFFATSHDYLLAMLIANDRLQIHLKNEMYL
jgi:hypothetical protein